MGHRTRVLLSMAVSALVAVPLTLTVAVAPASAATGKLLVTALGRTGVAELPQIHALNTNGHSPPVYGNAGQAFSVPDGQYSVMAAIGDSQATTLAETLVTVSGTGTTRVTLDARKGRLVKVTLDGQPLTGYLGAAICAGKVGLDWVDDFDPEGALYVVPSSSSFFSSSYLAVGNGAVLSGVVSSGVPSTLGGAWTTSQLAKVTLTVRSGEMISNSTAFELRPQHPDGPNGSSSCQNNLSGPVTSGQPPYRAATLASPGTWDVGTQDTATIGGASDLVGGIDSNHTFVAGHSYAYTYYMAAWAPVTSLAEVVTNGIRYGEPLFADPNFPGIQLAAKYAFTLSLNGHLIARRSSNSWTTLFPGYIISTRTAGWYTITDDVTRYRPGLDFNQGTLSPRTTFAFHFFANPAVITASDFPLIAGFGIKMVPEQLTLRNTAAPSSQTTVAITPFRPASFDGPSPADSVRKVQVWSSADGTHWTSLAVSHSASGYSVAVRNPASGFVYLRATVTGSHGDTSTETIYKAYAIS